MRLTTLKLRSLKPCTSTTRMLNSLPDIQGFGERMFQFDVKIPTKLWKAILRRRKFATDRCFVTQLELGQVRTMNDIDVLTYNDDTTLGILDDSYQVRHIMPGAVYVAPVEKELFDRFDIRVLHSVVLFRGPVIINFNVVLQGMGDSVIEAIFDVSRFPDVLTEKPLGALVSYTINV